MINIDELLEVSVVLDVWENETERIVKLYVPMTQQTVIYKESIMEAWVET